MPVTVPAAPEGVAAFALTAEELVTRWDALAAPLSGTLTSSDVNIDSDSFNFMVGPFVRISGQMGSDGLVDRVTFAGDPSGTRDDDRDVLSALGLTVALVEPSLPPDGRRQLISSLGLDLENPVLVGLDNSFEYLGNDYTLRWDEEAARLIFHVESVAAESGDEG